MKMLVCLHGNPLQGQEFDPILPSLQERGYQAVIHKRPITGSKLEPLLQSVSATAKVSGDAPFGIVAYSWGAYLALAYLERFPENVTGVLLINPLLIENHPLSPAARFITATPILRSIVLKLRSHALATTYVRRTFTPETPSQDVQGNLEKFLSHALVWRGAAAYKKLMLVSPLRPELKNGNVPIRVLFGENDRVAPMREQWPAIEHLQHINKTIVPGTGHALPWTHSDLIVGEIEKLF